MKLLAEDLRRGKYALLFLVFFLGMEWLLWKQICPMKILFGIPCPGCGLTRASLLICSLRWRLAWNMNATAFLWMALIVYAFVHRYVHRLSERFLGVFVIAVCLLTMGYYVFRMATVYPDAEPVTFYADNLVALLHEKIH